jgi:hypothetical protein
MARGKCARRAIAEVKQRWLVIELVTKNLLSRAPPFSIHHSDLGPRSGLWPVFIVGNAQGKRVCVLAWEH